MNTLLSKIWISSTRTGLCVLPLLFWATSGLGQVPVDDDGNAVGDWDQPESEAATGNEGIPLLSRQELQNLVGPVALYPDDLLAIVLPATTYPLQIVQAARFLEDLKADPSLEPDEDWDDSIIAVLNYPEIVELLNEDLDWTWQLGEAVVAQQGDVVTAIEAFRNTAYAAGNLQSDEHQTVSRDEGIIEITPVNDDIIYVPYYEPEHVVVYQPRPVYHYYTNPYPVYYYPYADSYAFNRGFFWGVTTAFTIGWTSDRLHVFHHSYSGHPYYGHYYPTHYWYRRPSVHVHNSYYTNHRNYVPSRSYTSGDYWRPSRNTRLRYSDQRITRNVHYSTRNTRKSVSRERDVIHYKRNTVNNDRNVVNNDRTRSANNRRAVSNRDQRSAPIRERRDNARRAPVESNERRNIVRQTPTPTRQHVERAPQREARNRQDGSAQPRNESRSESRSETKNRSRNEPKRETRQVEQRQARNRDEPRRRRN